MCFSWAVRQFIHLMGAFCMLLMEQDQWEAEDLRLLSLADDMPRAALTTIRRGTWALLEAFLDRAPSPGNGCVFEVKFRFYPGLSF